MANIGATTAFYKVENSLSKANADVSKSMERLATGKANANAGDRSSYVAMADTFRLDFVGTKAGIKGASVVMGYLETGMRVLDSASGLVARMQELAVLGGNDTNTTADSAAIDAEFLALGKEFHRLLDEATYKGKDVFNENGANLDLVSLGGRGAEMTFGMGDITTKTAYSDLISVANDGAVTMAVNTSQGKVTSDAVTSKLEAIQSLINTARVEAGSQYAALESSVNYTTDLTAQYELGFNTVNDVNFSMETAHLARNQILQQAATAMLAQANQGQQGLLQLIQG